MKIKIEEFCSMTKEKEIEDLAKEIVNAWNQKQDDETDKEFKERTKDKDIKE